MPTGRPRRPTPTSPVRRQASRDPYVAAIAMLVRRELSTAQVSERLRRLAFEPEQIEPALRRLVRDGALDDHRTAVTYAHRAAHVKMQGRRRAARELQGRGIDQRLAEAAVVQVYGELDEQVVLERALARRLRGEIHSRAELRRLYQYLLRQGFEASAAMATLTERAASTVQCDDTD